MGRLPGKNSWESRLGARQFGRNRSGEARRCRPIGEATSTGQSHFLYVSLRRRSMPIERVSRVDELETRVGTSSGGMAIKGPPVRDGRIWQVAEPSRVSCTSGSEYQETQRDCET